MGVEQGCERKLGRLWGWGWAGSVDVLLCRRCSLGVGLPGRQEAGKGIRMPQEGGIPGDWQTLGPHL